MDAKAVVAALLLAATSANGQSIGVYSDPACSSCDVRILQGETRTLWVCIQGFQEGVGPGFVRGDFRITGLPAGWHATNPNVASIVRSFYGSVVEGGFHFDTHQPVYGLVNLMSFEVIAASDVWNSALRVEAPTSGPLICPSLLYQSSEIEDCAEGLPLTLNGAGSCNVASVAATWSSVRSLYR